MPRAEDIVRFDDAPSPPGESPWVPGAAPSREIAIVDADPGWPQVFGELERRVRAALGDAALSITHVGSTSVPDLPAKPVIDIDLIVADSADERAYLAQLEAAGFTLTIREPWWYEHRCLVLADPRCNLHVFSPDNPEAARHVLFRDWLRRHPDDRDRYRDAKLQASDAANIAGEHAMQYNARKQPVIREIYARAFRAAGFLP
ncbi:GrpB family protein [Microbacterium sp.]|uniref:GrpB family protein n=1 Tax=Microbacterium sp. TaxID=51671 RepID=UPI002E33ABD1|nr:GrpB family protein [Microbacterium sp.]HEX5729333.1 GrpB family protein [Microbacterium sp.]